MSAPGSSRWCEAFAPAKINPWLEILARRPDGYHELWTVMVSLELGDRLRARRTRSGRITLALSGPAASGDVPLDGRNLAVGGAGIALELARGRGLAEAETGLELELEKHVPSQAGLGGASSDAAASLLAAAAALGLELSGSGGEAREARLALAKLGSDCAFFLGASEGAALCTGRGEEVEPLRAPAPPWDVALVVPQVASPTAAVYRALTFPLRASRPIPSFGGALPAASELVAPGSFHNRLEEAALRAVPALLPWRELLDEIHPGGFHLSGSGSSFFSVHHDPRAAAQMLETALAAARERGLATRGSWALRTGSGGARLVPLSGG